MIRTLLVCKMRATAIDLTERQFAIVKEKGVVIHPMVQEPLPSKQEETAPPEPALTDKPVFADEPLFK